MSASHRDEFPSKVIAAVPRRVAYVCSRCRITAIAAHSDPMKSVTSGQVCHIRGAAPNGPRYDRTQTNEQRKSIDNALWLCSVCSDIVDKDELKFPPPVLEQWKKETEAWIAGNAMIPSLPTITVAANAGFTI